MLRKIANKPFKNRRFLFLIARAHAHLNEHPDKGIGIIINLMDQFPEVEHIVALRQFPESKKSTIPAIQNLLQSDEPSVRIHAAIALVDLKNGRTDERTSRCISEGLAHSNAAFRRKVALAIGNMGEKGAVFNHLLRASRKDENQFVRHAAEEALWRTSRAGAVLDENVGNKSNHSKP